MKLLIDEQNALVEAKMSKSLLFCSAAALLAFAPIAWAQDHDRGGRGRDSGSSQSPAASQQAAPVAPAPPPPASDHASTNGRGLFGLGHPDMQNHDSTAPAPGTRDRSFNGREQGQDRSNRDGRGYGSDRPDRNNGSNRFDRPNNSDRFDNHNGLDRRGRGGNFDNYRGNFHAPHRFRGSDYNRPRGWYSHRWAFGDFLPSLFWSQQYWIDNYDEYDLRSPPRGTVWVRNGDDALLVDRYTGEVIRVEYGVFY